MNLTFASVSAFTRLTLFQPREAAERLLAMRVPDDARWLGFIIVIVLSVILSQFALILMQEEGVTPSLAPAAILQSVILLATVVAVQGVGRALGGTGTFPDTLLLVAWLQFTMLIFQLVQLVVIMVAPPLLSLVVIFALVVYLRMLIHFIMALHGFTSPLKVLVGIIFTVFGMSFAAAIILSIFGFGGTGAMQ